MRFIALTVFATACFATPALAQDPGRVFDNFDTAAGVDVIKTPVPPSSPKMVRKKNAQGKWVFVADDKLVKKTGLSKPAMNVSEGLAVRDTVTTKLVMGTSTHLKGFTTGDAAVDSYIVDSSRRYSIDPLLIYAQMHQESSFKRQAISYKGASGLMQLMPATARRMGVQNIFDPKQNIEGGVKYMRWLLDTFGGDLNLALAGYNAGEGAVMKYGWRIPPYRETQEYVRRISYRYNMISDPQYVQSARSGQLAKVDQKRSKPLSIYEQDVLTVRLPDGRLTLLTQ